MQLLIVTINDIFIFHIVVVAERRFIEKTETEKRFKERIKEIIEERDVLM